MSLPAGRLTAFDSMAAEYDGTFTRSAVGRALREIVWYRLEQSFASCRTVLELGCGTGEDARWLARRGVRVLATDASNQMIRIAREKADSSGCAHRIEFRCVPMEAIGSTLVEHSFDGVLSNFGAVNCARDLPALAASMAALLPRNGKLLWVVMGRYVPWEWVWYLLHGEWARAWRRMKPGGVLWRGLTVSYPSPATIARCLKPAFRIDRVTPLGLILPPTYAAPWLDRSPRSLAALTRLEALARRASTLAWLSDHYIVEATRF